MPYNTLDTLFNNLGPATAGYMTGQRESLGRQQDMLAQLTTLSELAKQNQSYGQNEQMNPLLVQNQGLVNRGLEAGLPGITADSTRKDVEARVAAGTELSSIASGNSKNKASVLGDQVHNAQAAAELTQQLSQQLMQTPPAARHSVAMQWMEQHSVSDNPAFAPYKNLVLNSSPVQMPQTLAAMSEKIRAWSNQNASTYMTEAMKANSHERIGAAANQMHRDVAKTMSDSRQAAKSFVPPVQLAKLPAAQASQVLAKAIATNTNLEGKPLTEEELVGYRAMYAQAVANQDVKAPTPPMALNPSGQPTQPPKPTTNTNPGQAQKPKGTADDPIILK